MPRIGLAFVFAASLCLVAGVSLGMYMGIVHDFTLSPVHAHLNLLGWASLALFGLTYGVWPALGSSKLARWHFALAAPSGVMFPFGIYMSMMHEVRAFVSVFAPMWLIGVILFAVGVGRTLFASSAAAPALAGAAA